MTGEDARQLSDDELQDELLKLKKERFNLRFQQATGQLENTARFNKVRKDIARIKTVMSQRKRRKAQEAEAQATKEGAAAHA